MSKSITVTTMRAEDVPVGSVERHVSGQGRLMPWRRVTSKKVDGRFTTFNYEGGDVLGSSARSLDLVEVQVERKVRAL